MSVFSHHFPLGLGTTRFPISGRDDTEGFARSVSLVRRALEAGVDYIDVGYNYSAGMAMPVLREASRQTDRPFSVTAKVMYGQDRTADDARKRVEQYIRELELEKARYFTCWCIWSYDDFEKIMAKGGIYEGALRLKDEGIVDHICGSLHCPPEDMVRIVESGAFEGITVSYSLLNAARLQPVLDLARERGTGVAVMNPLGGGLIAQNRNYFSFAQGKEDKEDTIHAALRFAKAHPAVDIVLGGVSSEAELMDSIGVFSAPDPELPSERMERVMSQLAELKGFCTGCKYCEGCPQGIPTSAVMQARNALLFEPIPDYNRQGPQDLLYNMQIFRKMFFDYNWLPDSAESPCIRCGKCEQACTQKLPIIESVSDIYRRAGISGYTRESHAQRLKELLYGKGFHKVGLYPNGGFAEEIMSLFREQYGRPDFEWLLFNSDEKMWGQMSEGLAVHGPGEIETLRPDIILICTYKFDQEIFKDLKKFQAQGIQIEKLHRDGEVPWIF